MQSLATALVLTTVILSVASQQPTINPNGFVDDLSADINDLWENFKVQFDKIFPNADVEDTSTKTFENNLRAVRNHNRQYSQGRQPFCMKINKYADMDINTVKQRMLGFRQHPKDPTKLRARSALGSAISVNAAPPAELNWVTKGMVSPVKDQGVCGSCYAFSANGAIEAQAAIKYARRANLSEQNLVDCTYNYGNGGCQGGWMDSCFKYIINNRGIDKSEAYPYEEADNGYCRYRSAYKAMTITNYVDLPQNEAAILDAVANIGPVAVAMDAGWQSFQFYNTGVYYEPKCTTDVNHAVLIVGYGTTSSGQKYWLVKNSWGTSWGDKGYIKIPRGSNYCGIALYASYPVV
ncbi:Procathepsin L [Halotydeus destructor]|nr:Procathepsin L [Halotydeus destructor]